MMTCCDPAISAKIAPGGLYWPLFQKLSMRQNELAALQETCEQLRDIEETVSLAEEVFAPLSPALQILADSALLRDLGSVPYIGEAVDFMRFSLTTMNVGIKALSWVHQVDALTVRPLTDAVLASNALLKSQDDRDVPEVIRSYEASLQALQQADANLSQNIGQTDKMLRLLGLVQKIVRRYKADDAELIEALSGFHQALQQLRIVQTLTQDKLRKAIVFVQEVLAAVPREERPQETATRVKNNDETTRPVVPETEPGTAARPAPEQIPGSETPSASQEEAPSAHHQSSTPEPSSTASPRPSGHGRADRSGTGKRDVVVFAGGALMLGAGLGALAYVIVQVLGSAGVGLRRL